MNQNRALNGDIVCVEILSEEYWEKGFTSIDPINILDKEDDFEEKLIEDK